MIEDITKLVNGIDKNRELLMALIEQIHYDMQEIIGNNMPPRETEREKAMFLILVQNYIAGFMTADCDPDEGFTQAVRQFYARGTQHGYAYLMTRKEFQQ
jgi:hypothetical protein